MYHRVPDLFNAQRVHFWLFSNEIECLTIEKISNPGSITLNSWSLTHLCKQYIKIMKIMSFKFLNRKSLAFQKYMSKRIDIATTDCYQTEIMGIFNNWMKLLKTFIIL